MSSSPKPNTGYLYAVWLRLKSCHKASALLEMALVMPLMLVLFFGVLEFARYRIIHMKVDKIASITSNAMAAGETGCFADGFINTVRAAAVEVMAPFEFTDESTIGVASVGAALDGGECDEGGQLCIHDEIEPVAIMRLGDEFELANGRRFTPGAGRDYVVAEIRYGYQPLLGATSNFIPMLAPQQLIKTFVHRSRYVGFARFGGC